MEREFLPYNLALELKQLGFDEPCICIYSSPKIKELKNTMQIYQNSGLFMEKNCTAPMYQQAFRFFREKKKLLAEVKPIDDWNSYTFVIYGEDAMSPFFEIFTKYKEYNTYEEAQIECIKALIKFAKQNKL